MLLICHHSASLSSDFDLLTLFAISQLHKHALPHRVLTQQLMYVQEYFGLHIVIKYDTLPGSSRQTLTPVLATSDL